MNRLIFIAVEVLAAAVGLLPAYYILNRIHFHDRRKSMCYCVFSAYLAAVYALVGLPHVAYIRLELNLNAIPFLGMAEDWKNSVLNILLFVPLGAMLPLLWEKYRSGKRTICFGLCMSLVIELLQIFTFRATDINDLITNGIGTGLGYWAGRLLAERFPTVGKLWEKHDDGELYIVLAVTCSVMFFVHPFISAIMWNLVSR